MQNDKAAPQTTITWHYQDGDPDPRLGRRSAMEGYLAMTEKPTDHTTDLFDVVAVNIKTGVRRQLAMDKREADAEAIITTAVMRRGVQDEFYMAIPIRERVQP